MNKRYITAVVAAASAWMAADAQYAINYEASITAGMGSGGFAPYYISALNHGRFSSSDNVQAEASLWRPVERDKRFSYGFGLDVIAGYASSVDYGRYDAASQSWFEHSVRPSAVRIQQLYGEIKYRGVFLTAGMREHESALLNNRLTSGDLVESGNARPMPEVRVGFIDFQDIPFTQGWVQIQGEVSYGKRQDNGWWEDHYNYYNSFLTRDEWYTYKRCYFRTRPSEPFSVTVGMQAAGAFGGNTSFYSKGVCNNSMAHDAGLKTFFKMLLVSKGETFYTGNHLGAWDFRARYRFRGGHELAGYFSWPFEDGSGIGKQNGWDGLWGVEYKASRKGLVSGALIEYLDFTNQSGPIHFNPADWPGTTLTDHVSGSDNYYNHSSYNSYCYYGMSIGSPALMAPIYNLDGYSRYVANAVRGFHVGVEGELSPSVEYRLKGGYRKAYGNGDFMLPEPIHLTSVMADVTWRPSQVKGLTVNAQIEIDRGNMPANAFGAMVSVRYDGLLKL